MYAEVLKCVVCMVCIIRDTRGDFSVPETLKRFAKSLQEMKSLILPALLFFLSNILTIYSLIYLRSYIFAAIMNARIVFAAALSVPFLGKALMLDQWRAIIVIYCATTLLCSEILQVTAQASSIENEDTLPYLWTAKVPRSYWERCWESVPPPPPRQEGS
jgi:uncharacterized membrane protein